MKRGKTVCAALLIPALGIMYVMGGSALAGGESNGMESLLSYAAKVVCNPLKTSSDYAVRGNYRTVVNIHNPYPFDVSFSKKDMGSPPDWIASEVLTILAPVENGTGRETLKPQVIGCRDPIESGTQTSWIHVPVFSDGDVGNDAPRCVI